MNKLQIKMKEEQEDYDPCYLERRVPVKWEDHLINDEESSVLRSLGSKTEPATGYILLTINYPRTKQFLKLNQKEQGLMYKQHFNKLVSQNDFFIKDQCILTLEHCSSGQIHAHALLPCKGKYFIAGVVSDTVKFLKTFIPNTRQMMSVKYFNERRYHEVYERYRDAHVCVQYKSEGDKYVPEWETYIRKENYFSYQFK